MNSGFDRFDVQTKCRKHGAAAASHRIRKSLWKCVKAVVRSHHRLSDLSLCVRKLLICGRAAAYQSRSAAQIRGTPCGDSIGLSQQAGSGPGPVTSRHRQNRTAVRAVGAPLRVTNCSCVRCPRSRNNRGGDSALLCGCNSFMRHKVKYRESESDGLNCLPPSGLGPVPLVMCPSGFNLLLPYFSLPHSARVSVRDPQELELKLSVFSFRDIKHELTQGVNEPEE